MTTHVPFSFKTARDTVDAQLIRFAFHALRYRRIGRECAGWGGVGRGPVGRPRPLRSRSRSHSGKDPDSNAGVGAAAHKRGTRRRASGGRGPALRAGRGRTGKLVRASASRAWKEADPRPWAARCGRLGTSAGSAGRWLPLRGGRVEGGPGRRPGGGALPGAGPLGLHLRTRGLRPSAGTARRRAAIGQSGYGVPLGFPDRPPGGHVAARLGSRWAAGP